MPVPYNSNTESRLIIQELKRKYPDRVIFPGHPDYDRMRTPMFGGYDRHPSAFFRPANAAQVAEGIKLARENGVDLAIRSGGHGLAVHGLINDGVTLDLVEMNSVQIDETARTAWADSGSTAGHYIEAASKYGLTTGFGDTATVGLGGLTLGGGIGYLVRKYGLTIDQLLAAEVVTADGEILHADSQTHPDLFWALRGGGGNFGVVTRFKYQLHPVDLVFGGMLILPGTAEVIAGMVDYARAAPEDLSLIANVMKAPPMPFLPPEVHGKLVVMINLVFSGKVEDGEAAVAPLRKLAAPLADMLRPIPYPQMFVEEASDFHPCISARSQYYQDIDRIGVQTILEQLQVCSAMMAVCQIRVLGGAASRIPDDATAYAHRKHPLMANFVAIYPNPQDAPEQEDWAEKTAAALPTDGPDVYVNFLGPANLDSVQQAYPGVWERLTRVKAQYDPDNFFHGNHNIPPARL